MAVPGGHNTAMVQRPGALPAQLLVSPFAARQAQGGEEPSPLQGDDRMKEIDRSERSLQSYTSACLLRAGHREEQSPSPTGGMHRMKVKRTPGSAPYRATRQPVCCAAGIGRNKAPRLKRYGLGEEEQMV